MIKNSPIPFRANLVVSPDIYQHLSAQDEGELKNTLAQYKRFLDLPKVKQMSIGDTITKSKARASKGKYSYKLDFDCAVYPDKTIQDAGVYNVSSPKDLSLFMLNLQTIQFLCNKFDSPFFGLRKLDKTIKALVDKFNSLQNNQASM